MIRLLIADDHAIVRSGLVQLLGAYPDLQIVASVASGEEVLREVQARELDLVLLDLNMPGPSGIELIERLQRLRPRLPVVVLSMLDDAQVVTRALRAGAAGYVTKDSGVGVLREAIVRVAAQGNYIDPRLVDSVVFRHDGTAAARHDSLSARERQVLGMIVAGMRLGDIADRLYVSAKTVSTHKMRLMAKLGVDSNAALVRYAIENGLAEAPPAAAGGEAAGGLHRP